MDGQELGRRIKRRRQELKMSQEVLAERAKISRNYLSIMERGEARNVSTGVLEQLAAALEVSASELYGEPSSSDIIIPSALRQFGINEGLPFSDVDWLARMPRRGREPQTEDEWRELYQAVKQFLDHDD
jgi:transcriptional regulator with XRE-family HTH domain